MQDKIYTRSEIAETIAPLVLKYGIPAIYLFGSYARGTATPDSDIDLLIDTTGTRLNNLLMLGALYSELEDAFGKRIDLITVSALEQPPMMPSDIAFRESVYRERVKLYDVA